MDDEFAQALDTLRQARFIRREAPAHETFAFRAEGDARCEPESNLGDQALAESQAVGHAVDLEKTIHRTGWQRRFHTGQGIERAGESLTDSMFHGHDEEDLNRKLEIAMKKHALGIPYDEDELTGGKSFRNKGILAAFGIHAAGKIPNPKFLKPAAKSSSSLLGSLFSGIKEETTLGAATHGGSSSGGSTLARILRRRVG